MKDSTPRTNVAAIRLSWSGWGLPSVAKREPAVLGCNACAMGTSYGKRRIVAPRTPVVYRLAAFTAGFQPEAGVRVVCTVCTGVCSSLPR
ncbi:hypothetical protein GCM10010339_32710 [Streptomyces alanosinicus]|uniref:Uncharacterized protein n=1 Tax=Streptomyces alanosinicus TaxID=68171 RepID=A0A918YHT3_9ACTN|nr:hypothetical protein GCM10010339_32710 [Streptomyces alanosinicus]